MTSSWSKEAHHSSDNGESISELNWSLRTCGGIALVCSSLCKGSSVFSMDFWFFKTISYPLQNLSHFLLGFFLSFLLLSFLLGLMKTSILLEETINKNHRAQCCDQPRTMLFLTWVFAKSTSHAFSPSLTTSISDVGKWSSNDKWLNLPIKRGVWEKHSAGSRDFFSANTPVTLSGSNQGSSQATWAGL